MKNTDDPIVIEQTFNVSLLEIWCAITELNRMKEWFFKNIPSFEPKVGFETRFIIKNEGRIFPHIWKIVEVDPEKRIAYNWKYEGYQGDSVVVFDLSQDKEVSKLTLTHQVTEDFPQNIEEFKRESCLQGWKWFIKKSLKDYLEK
ncbi:SRPBCC domain-containing protein [Aquimarina sp. AD10]|uniref:ATPase n=1 Tax=Aquimarina aggregata TaxID=1642818 RepID=A0A163ACP5_9FLAO|nr:MULTISPECIES: SRPBCC domain-containing protein [Aquimarina]AXT63229.1 SRPBCC domain-containing protein [Aquimarina sp. AD10]KZS40445.1 ATPase [Aquimarina aggregata]RKN00759.1 SRPBCC domain-containing protein [Aquimarina sp. AD10]